MLAANIKMVTGNIPKLLLIFILDNGIIKQIAICVAILVPKLNIILLHKSSNLCLVMLFLEQLECCQLIGRNYITFALSLICTAFVL